MGNPNDQVQCALVAEQYEDETTKTTSQVLLQTSKVAPEPELEPATEEEDQEPVADPVSEALKEGKKEDEPAGEVLVSESTPADENEKGVPPTVDEILEKMNGMDFEKEKEVAKQDAAAEKEPAKDEVLDEKSSEEVVKAKAAVEEDEAAEKKSEK